ncbi:hypothetical protein [Nannocystis pusilla]|uniref:hypothetical protein n=1 Tax=Nannocystis pusilla TaxID=889268 RepID=UPI003B7BE2A7
MDLLERGEVVDVLPEGQVERLPADHAVDAGVVGQDADRGDQVGRRHASAPRISAAKAWLSSASPMRIPPAWPNATWTVG